MEWHGFREQRREIDGKLRFRIMADFSGTDEDPVPCAIVQQALGRTIDTVILDQSDLEWLRDEAIPAIIERMEQRP